MLHCRTSQLETLEIANTSRQTGGAVVAKHIGHGVYQYAVHDMQDVQHYIEKINQATSAMQSNVQILTALCQSYHDIMTKKGLYFEGAKPAVETFATKINDMVDDLRMRINHSTRLGRTIADRKSLIAHHLQSQTIQEQRETTIEMEKLTRSMHEISMHTQREAIAMRIITVITMIFLPATFVSVRVLPHHFSSRC